LNKLISDLKIYIVAHSYGACIISSMIERFEKIALISPAFNQKELNKYWFTKQYMKKNHPTTEVNWSNFNILLNENSCFLLNKYEEFVYFTKRSTKYNYISNKHLLSVWDKDYSGYFHGYEDKVLHIHGEMDDVVPLQSLNISFQNQFIVKNGDHDIESKDLVASWSSQLFDFFT
ncbi:MAG: hypothetical protein V3575_05340, partial [Candidatus Absconditabacteria bacterium]